jgi:hypothetical protein
MDLDAEIMNALSTDRQLSLVDNGYNSDPQDDLESPEGQEHVIGHHSGSSATSYEPLMQLTEVALNLPVEQPFLTEPSFAPPDSEIPADADPESTLLDLPSSSMPKGEHMGSPAEALLPLSRRNMVLSL